MRLKALSQPFAATATGSTGEETAVAVALYGCDATSADQTITAITRDAEVKTPALSYGSTINDDTKKGAARAQLAAVGIICR